MPSYVSRDVERGVTLVYRSGRVHPIANVTVVVSDTSLIQPTNYSLKVRKPDGSFVTKHEDVAGYASGSSKVSCDVIVRNPVPATRAA